MGIFTENLSKLAVNRVIIILVFFVISRYGLFARFRGKVKFTSALHQDKEMKWIGFIIARAALPSQSITYRWLFRGKVVNISFASRQSIAK